LTALDASSARPSIIIPNGLTANSDWASLPLFDRTSWKRVRFGDVVENCAETCDPAEAGLERFVAMEHLEPGSLHVRSWGNVADGTTFTRRCRPGQVLFGKRRAYQRKVAVAEFEAVVSGDIYVLAPKDPQRLLPELLPFLCLSERFFQHAVGTSAGSLSPRTNWSSLASFELDLPPLDQQRRIAEILWAVNEHLHTVSEQSSHCLFLLRTISDELCWNNKWPAGEIKNIAVAKLGGFLDGDWIESKDQSPAGIRLLQLADIGDGQFLNKSDRYISEQTFKRLNCNEVMPGDLLISRMADPIGRACIVPALLSRMITVVDCTIARINTKSHDPNYWLNLTNTSRRRQLEANKAGGSTRLRISRKNLESIRIPIPTFDYQVQSAERLQDIQKCADASWAHTEDIRLVRTALLNAIFQ
jgi:type I restriction enzyme S subunit